MRLIERELGLDIELKENIISVVVIEKVESRLRIIDELYSQINGSEGNWILVENEKQFDLSKSVDMILEPFSVELNSKKIKNRLYQDIKEVAQEYYFSQGMELHSNICTYIENVLEKIPYPIKYEDEWNLLEILKVYDVELEEESESKCEKLFNYIKLVNNVCGNSVFILVNIKQYLIEQQVLELYKLVMYSKIQLVLIEFNMYNEKNNVEDIYVLDADGWCGIKKVDILFSRIS